MLSVVYRPFPTSNHNIWETLISQQKLYIVRFLHQTTTACPCTLNLRSLYIVRFLHQTTTNTLLENCSMVLYIVRFLHQTTTLSNEAFASSVLYIVRFLHQTTTCKARMPANTLLYIVRFLHQTTTIVRYNTSTARLYIVRFLHQTTTAHYMYPQNDGCISSVSYIKPQPGQRKGQRRRVVYRPFPTSNHNDSVDCYCMSVLYIVRFLHQTTTPLQLLCHSSCCISSVSYIKPQRSSKLII